jgi:hypothetical protein
MINFLATKFLWLLPLSIIPVIIHLFFRNRKKRVYFSSLFLLKQLRDESIRSLRIREWLLLLIRVLILMLLILSFARPVWNRSGQGTAKGIQKSNLWIAIDQSLSMKYRADDGLLLKEKALKAIETFLQSHINDYNTRIITEKKGITKSLKISSMQDWNTFKKTYRYSSFPFRIKEVIQFLQNQTEADQNNIVFIISDFQSSFWSQKYDWADFINPVFLFVTFGITSNAGFQQVNLIHQAVSQLDSDRISIQIKNYSSNPSTLQFLLKQEQNVIYSRQMEFNSGESKNHTVRYSVMKSGWTKFALKLSPDEIQEDNVLYMTRYLPKNFKILYVSTNRNTPLGTFLSSFQNQYHAEVKWIAPEELPSIDPGQFPILIFQNSLQEMVKYESLLAVYVKNGHQLVLLPENIQSEIATGMELFGVKTKKIYSNAGTFLLNPDILSGGYSLWKSFLRKNKLSVRSYIVFASTGSIDRLNRQFYLYNQNPLLYHWQSGKGKVFIWATDVSPIQSNILISPLFLEWLKNQILTSQNKYNWLQPFYTTGRINEFFKDIKTHLKGRILIIDPELRKNNIFMARELSDVLLRDIFSSTGIYTIVAGGDTLYTAINFSPDEFKREQVQPEILKKFGRVIVIGNVNRLKPEEWIKISKVRLTPYLLIAVFILLMMELFLEYKLKKGEG